MVDFMFVIALLMAVVVTATVVDSGGVGKACSRLHQRSMGWGCDKFYSISEFVLIGNAYRNKTASSYVVCAVFCLQDEACESFNYGKDDKLCQLNSAVCSVDKPTLLQPSKGSFFFDKEIHASFPKVAEMSPSMSTANSAACPSYTTETEHGPEILSGQAEPIHLELRAQSQKSSDTYVFVNFYQTGQSLPEMYIVELHSTTTTIFKKSGSAESTDQPQVQRDLIGSRVTITFTSALITLEVEGEDGILLRHVEENPNTANSWSVSIGGRELITWEFYGVCNFN